MGFARQSGYWPGTPDATLDGTRVENLFLSLIHTCQLNDVNPFDYLTGLQRHAANLAARPENRMPWNYRRRTQETGADTLR